MPIPRATTAAWLVIPPRAVSTARAATMPWKSSGVVSSRTRITRNPFRRALLGDIGIEHGADRSRRRDSPGARQQIWLGAGARIDHRMQQLIELLGVDAHHCLALR